jgi:glycosyltransferase involved in cell wall biosynthesis
MTAAPVLRAAPTATAPAHQRVRVVRIIARLNIGGPAIHTVLATAGLDREQFETTLVAGRPGAAEGDMGYYADLHGVEIAEIPELGRDISPFDDVRALLKLVRLLRRLRPDIVHTHTAKAGTLGRVAALLARVPVRVHTFHGHVFDGYFSPWKTALFLQVERTLARFTTRVLTVSEGQQRELSDKFGVAPRERVEVVPLGLDLSALAANSARGELRAELGITPLAPLIGIVGRMVPIKNHDLFFEAAALLRKNFTDARFVVVGAGEREQELRALAERLHLSANTHFLGWRRDLDRIYADLDVVALTSRNEGTPVALIEALAAGVPVCATAVGGVPDLLRNGERGVLVAPPFTPERFAAGLTRALEPAARERARACRAQTIEEFGSERLCRDLERIYNGLLSRGH